MSDAEKNPYEQEDKLNPILWLQNWVPMVFYTSIFGSISVMLGAITPGRSVSRWAMQNWAARVRASLGVQCEIKGAEILESAPQCVFIANHCSALDILIIGSFIGRDYRWLAKAPLFKTPFLGWHLSAAGHIPVYRGGAKSKNRNIQDRVGGALEEGASILYFPEGTRNPDGKLQPFRKGAFVTAVNHDLPIIPIVLKGTGELMKKGAKHLNVDRTRLCTMTVLPPIKADSSIEENEERVLALNESASAIFRNELGQEHAAKTEMA